EQEARAARWAQEVRAVERTAPERAATDGMVLQRTYNGIFDPSYTQTPDVGIPPPPVHENVEARRQVQRSESARDEERRDEQRRQEQRQEEIRDERFREERRDEERRQEERDQERRAEERRQEERRNEH
ncbi:MAG TPA: hypothetical protein VFH51_13645, partial [Myxococcota bacterium]|nr:hypothetical protein [Myxococcota bacterium]